MAGKIKKAKNKENDGKRDGKIDREALDQYKNFSVDVFCICKTNINHNNKHILAKWKKVIKQA